MLSAIRQNTSMDTMLPAIAGNRRMSRLLAQLVFILAGGTLLAASPQFNVMVPPSPVPITGQTLVVLMIGMAFGPRLGAITILAYILGGLCDLPVFRRGCRGVGAGRTIRRLSGWLCSGGVCDRSSCAARHGQVNPADRTGYCCWHACHLFFRFCVACQPDWHGKSLPFRDPALFMGGCDEAGCCGLPDAGCLVWRQGR